MLKKIVLLMMFSIGYVDAGGFTSYTLWKNRASCNIGPREHQILYKQFTQYPRLLEGLAMEGSAEDKRG